MLKVVRLEGIHFCAAHKLKTAYCDQLNEILKAKLYFNGLKIFEHLESTDLVRGWERRPPSRVTEGVVLK